MKTLLFASLLAAPFLAHAQTDSIEAKRKTCHHRASITNEMKQCEYNAYKEADAELARLNQRLLENIERDHTPDSKELKTRVMNANRTWEEYRDANCALKSGQMIGGSGESLLLATCAVNATLDRVKELQTLL